MYESDPATNDSIHSCYDWATSTQTRISWALVCHCLACLSIDPSRYTFRKVSSHTTLPLCISSGSGMLDSCWEGGTPRRSKQRTSLGSSLRHLCMRKISQMRQQDQLCMPGPLVP
jgi:hypothetical protein